jgi:Helix-hairpin-helix domain
VSSNPGAEIAATADDLTRIAGIGTKIARRLNEAGIGTYAELVSRSAGDIMALLPDVSGLALARVDGWRHEARELAAAQALRDRPAAGRGSDQHYESFLVRVLLNEDGTVRRTTVRHVGTGAERHWPGLGVGPLSEFIQASAISAPPPAADSPSAAVPPPASAPPPAAAAGGAEPLAGAEPPGEAVPAAGAAPEATRGEPAGARPAPFTAFAVLSVERTTVRASEPFTMTMTLDLGEGRDRAGQLGYSAVVVAKPLGSGPRRTVARSDGLVPATAPIVTVAAAGLPPGAYRLDGAVSLFEPGGRPLGLAAIAEGFLVHVPPA